MSQPKIRFEHVWKVFSGDHQVVAIEDFHLEVKEGEFLCVLGPSGCGKTTLLNMLAGLVTPTRGKIYIDDVEVVAPGPDRAYVFQEYALFPWMTVLDNVAFGLESRGIPPKERYRIAQSILNSLGLSNFVQTYPHTLSGGMSRGSPSPGPWPSIPTSSLWMSPLPPSMPRPATSSSRS